MAAAGGSDDGEIRIGLALGGGAAQGFAHIAVLEALDEMGLRPASIAATSMGAVIGAAYASGMSGAEIRAYATGVFGNRSQFLSRLWNVRPRRLKDVEIGIGQYDLERVLKAFLPETLPPDFDGLHISFKAVATDYYAGEAAVLSEGPLIRSIAASAAVPMLFRPVVVDGRVMVDGGLTNPVPFDVLEGMDIVIAADVVTEPAGRSDRLPGGLESLFGSASLLMRSLLMAKLDSRRPPGLLIRLPTEAFHVLDFTKAIAIIKASEAVKDEVKRKIEGVLASRVARQ